jgi:arylsulfatase
MIELGILDEKWPLTPRDGSVPAWDDEPHKAWRAHAMAVYAAQIEMLDRGVGRIVETLEKHDALEHTLIFVLADNGGCAEVIREGWGGLHIPQQTRDGRPVQVGNNPEVMPGNADDYQSYGVGWANASNTPFRLYKHFVHEGGVSTPLICHWPATIKQRGELTSARGHLVDIMASCLDVAGAGYPLELDGKPITPLAGESLLPALRGEPHERGPIYWEHEGNRAVRDGNWKLVSRYPGDWELYDMRADRCEINNLAARRPAQVKRLAALYDDWAARSNVVPWAELTRPAKQE